MIDRAKRRALLARLRTEQTCEEAELDPSERYQLAAELVALSDAVASSDEPAELWLAIQRRLRKVGG